MRAGSQPLTSDAGLDRDGLADITAGHTDVQYGRETWNTLSALAFEYARAVRNAFPGEASQDQDYCVQHELHQAAEHSSRPVTATYGASIKRAEATLDNPAEADSVAQDPTAERSNDYVRAEAARVQATFAYHVDTTSGVVLRFDFINNYDTRVAMFVLMAATVAGMIILLVQFCNIMTKDSSTARFQDSTTYLWNISVGSVCWALITSIIAVYAWRLLQAHRQKRVWEAKRKRIVMLFLIEAAVQWINLAFYVAPNIYMLYHPCEFFSTFLTWCGWIRWTCWDTLFLLFLVHAYGGRVIELKPKIKFYMDAPWHKFWPCLVPWVALQIPSSIAWLRNVSAGGTIESKFFTQVEVPGCKKGLSFGNCAPDATTQISVFVTVGVAIVYFAITCALLLQKLRNHKKVSYRIVQMGSLFFRLQLRLRIVVMVFFALCLVLLWLVRLHSCASYMFAWLGIMPMQVVMTANIFVWLYICMPHSPLDDAAAKRTWEQEFAWTEADKPVKLAARNLTVPNNDKLNKQPIFCFETMMHMLYWSCLVYDYKRATAQHQCKRSQCKFNKKPPSVSAETAAPIYQTEKTSLKLHTALGLYNLTDSELFWELQLDTRCLVGWSEQQIVVAFRGTASMKNAWSDLQAWRVEHPPVRGHNFCGTRPLVHVGFMKSWLAGGFNSKVISRVMEIANSRKVSPDKLKIYVTGHSLGGALATLAAYDICKQLQASGREDVKVMCYSFGAPRTGNHAFANDYNRVVPDTWSIINDQDVVTRGGKFLFLYKRPGHRVILNGVGQMMVSPSSIEASLHQSPGGSSVDQHFLTSYHHAILKVVLSQFTSRGFSDGMEGIVRLVQASPYLKDLLETHMGMQSDDMQQFLHLSPEAREGKSLAGAHLPPRGFYRIKSASSCSTQRKSSMTYDFFCGAPGCFPSRSSAQHSNSGDLSQVSDEPEFVTKSSEEQDVVVDIKDPQEADIGAFTVQMTGSG